MYKKIAAGAGAVLIAGAIAFNLSPIGRVYLHSGTGIVAKQTCSLTFVTGLESERAQNLYVRPLLGAAADFISVNIDEEDREVRTSILGLWGKRAVYRDGLGCSLVHNRRNFDDTATAPMAQPHDTMALNIDHRDANFDGAALDAAVDAAFADPEWGPRNTLGIAILHRGELVAERYAEGLSAETRFHGWSMTKSFATTLAGVLEYQGRVDTRATGSVPALAEDRADITIEHLLRMTGGLAIAETNTGTDPTSEMLFNRGDMAHYAATRRRLHAPGEHWQYMSGNTVLANHAMQHVLGDTLEEQIAGVRAALFEPLGMNTAVIEVDESGTMQGSSYMYATTHDWARLALLYANDGMVDGERLFAEDWADRVATPTAASQGDYGMGFWIPNSDSGLPSDAYMMNGFQGQNAMILTQDELVIVRFGASNGISSGTYELTRSVVAARREAELPVVETGATDVAEEALPDEQN
jgi:CubicO group peptidase (beta-lactamase class C family)